MLVLLLPLAFLLIFCVVSKIKNLLFREKILITFVLISFALVIITEILSAFRLLTASAISITWICVIAGSTYLSRSKIVSLALAMTRNEFVFARSRKTAKGDFLTSGQDGSLSTKLSVLAIGAILTITFILALTSAPNNIDAQIYGLSRVMHWIQNGSLEFYPTHITLPTYLAPFASYASLHTILLSGRDAFTNLVQWAFSIGTFAAVSLLGMYFKAGFKTQVFIGTVAVTIPVGILQSSSTGEDYILSFFLAAFVYFSLVYTRNRRRIFLVSAAIALGLALLTKQIAYLYTLPFLFWFLAKMVLESGFKKALNTAGIVAIIVIIANFGFFWRNLNFAGFPLFSLTDQYVNSPVGLQSLVSGFVKNASMHFSTPFPSFNQGVYHLISNIHNLLGIPLNTPYLNWYGREFEIPHTQASENKAPNTLHMLLLIFSAVVIFKHKTKPMDRKRQAGFQANIADLKYYLLSLFSAFILFSAVIRWQQVGSRYHLPLFVLGAVPIGLTIGNRRRANLALLVLGVTSIYFLTTNINKPLVSVSNYLLMTRDRQYFIQKPQLYEPYLAIAGKIKENNYKNVGLFMEEFNWDFEYPLWVLIKRQSPDARIEHVDVANPTGVNAKIFKPDVVVFIKQDKEVIQKYIEQEIPVLGLSN